MIKYVDDRCKDWARQVASSGHNQKSVLARMMEGDLSGGPRGGILIGRGALEVEAIVCRLEHDLKAVVMQQYLGKGNSVENAKALRMSKKKFYVILDDAHVRIDRELHLHFFANR